METNKHTQNTGEVVMYQPDGELALEVKMDAVNETVWLTIDQMAQLFQRDKSVIGKHVRKIFYEGELTKESVWAKNAYTAKDGKTYIVDFYNLDVIISVGYRVKSQAGTRFRIWATGVLREYLLHGFSVNRQLVAMQERSDQRFSIVEKRLDECQNKLDFFIRTSIPPAEQVFFEGDFLIARVALEKIVKTANRRVIIVDGYVSAETLDILEARKENVEATIYTSGVGEGMQRLRTEHDRLFPNRHIEIIKWKNPSHDRWIIADDTLYHCGHSVNDTGKRKISAISRMELGAEVILGMVKVVFTHKNGRTS